MTAAGFYDAECSKCRRRIGWAGTLADRPPCSNCGDPGPSAKEVEKAEAEMEKMRNRLRGEHSHVKPDGTKVVIKRNKRGAIQGTIAYHSKGDTDKSAPSEPDELVVFAFGEIEAALELASKGGQALHLFDPRPFCKPTTPTCFKRATEAGHLFDQNKVRLRATARRLGVRRVHLHRRGRGQHVDLVGAPLRRAKAEAREPDLF